MNYKDSIDKLWQALINFDWFEKIELSKESHNTLVVYVDYMTMEVLTTIPDNIDGFDVIVHFAASISSKYIQPILLDKSIN